MGWGQSVSKRTLLGLKVGAKTQQVEPSVRDKMTEDRLPVRWSDPIRGFILSPLYLTRPPPALRKPIANSKVWLKSHHCTRSMRISSTIVILRAFGMAGQDWSEVKIQKTIADSPSIRSRMDVTQEISVPFQGRVLCPANLLATPIPPTSRLLVPSHSCLLSSSPPPSARGIGTDHFPNRPQLSPMVPSSRKANPRQTKRSRSASSPDGRMQG
jgi:hypothetical protein